MKYSTVLFDLDGTILDTLEDLSDALNFALAKNGCETRTLAEVRSFVGNGMRKLVSRALPAQSSPELEQRVLECHLERYAQHCADKTRPYEGIVPLLNKLRENGVKTAVVSNKVHPQTCELVERMFPHMFDLALGEREGFARKPAPDSVLFALRELGADACQTVYVGDSEVDLLTAENSTLECIGVSWGFRTEQQLKESGAKCIARTPAELLGFLE